MAKQDICSRYLTTLDMSAIKRALTQAWASSTVSNLQAGPLDELPPLAVLMFERRPTLTMSKKWGRGDAAVQVLVQDAGTHREVEIIALAGIGAVRMMLPSNNSDFSSVTLKSSEIRARDIEAGLRAADPGLRGS
jgi:hypothetical protein